MDIPRKPTEDLSDPDFFDKIKAAIEKDLANMKKMVNSINQMRVEAAYLECDLMMSIDSAAWEDITEFIGLGSVNNSIDN